MKIHVIGGGTFVHVRPHFSLSAPAYGQVARDLFAMAQGSWPGKTSAHLHLSRMAGGRAFETNDDLRDLLLRIAADHEPSVVFLTAAVCDFEPGDEFAAGKSQPRLKTKEGGFDLPLKPSEKLVRLIRSKYAPNPRKDIFLVAFKTTTGATDDEMFLAGLKLLKEASANLVLVNDIHRKENLIVTPEQARYQFTPGEIPADTGLTQRDYTMSFLFTMAMNRAQGSFTRSTVVEGQPVPWGGDSVFPALRTVVDHCIAKGAYKDLLGRGATVGHFAQKLDSDSFLTSRRNSNFNEMEKVGLVLVEAEGDERVVAHGARPSVGGQSQRIIFREHGDTDCIVHFHCPPRPEMAEKLSIRAQWRVECGSHQCGQNTSDGLQEIEPGIKVVYLDKHGPNIVFKHDIDPARVTSFIDRYFDLSKHTGEGDIPSYARRAA
jgi:hypothetical protein